MKKKSGFIPALLLTLIQFFGLEISISPEETFQMFSILEIPLFLLIFLLTCNIIQSTKIFDKKQMIPVIFLSVLFSFFVNTGQSIEKTGDLSELSFVPPTLFKTFVSLTGHALFFFMSICFLFRKLNETSFIQTSSSANTKSSFFFHALTKKPFLTSFVSMFLLSLPAMIATFPGIMNGDIYFQIAQGFGLENKKEWVIVSPPKPELYKMTDGERVKINTKLSNYHPVAHTMLLRECLLLGYRLFGSDNAGAFILILLQNLLLDLVLAYCVSKMLKQFSVKPIWGILFLAYFLINPAISGQMTTLSKEGIYIPFLILVILENITIISEKSDHIFKDLILCLIGIIGVIVFRNEGKFLLTASFFITLLFLPGKRRIYTALFSFTLIFALSYELLILPACNVAPGSVREMLSLPVQQTARYVRDAGNTVTETEKKHINAVWDYDLLGEKYNPDISDPVKQTYRQTATISDLKRYAFTWYDMLLKRPDIYILAAMNNYYLYFYPKNTGSLNTNFGFASGEMWLANKNCSEINLDLHFPEELSGIRNFYENARLWIFSLPLLRCFWVSAFYVWALFIYEIYCFTRKNRNAFISGIPMLIQILVFITGPTNGNYGRYIFILKACLPVILIFGIFLIHSKSGARE